MLQFVWLCCTLPAGWVIGTSFFTFSTTWSPMLANLHLLDQQLAQSHWRFAHVLITIHRSAMHKNAALNAASQWVLGNAIWSLLVLVFDVSKLNNSACRHSDLAAPWCTVGALWVSGGPTTPEMMERLQRFMMERYGKIWKGVSLDSLRSQSTREVQNANTCKRSLGAWVLRWPLPPSIYRTVVSLRSWLKILDFRLQQDWHIVLYIVNWIYITTSLIIIFILFMFNLNCSLFFVFVKQTPLDRSDSRCVSWWSNMVDDLSQDVAFLRAAYLGSLSPSALMQRGRSKFKHSRQEDQEADPRWSTDLGMSTLPMSCDTVRSILLHYQTLMITILDYNIYYNNL